MSVSHSNPTPDGYQGYAVPASFFEELRANPATTILTGGLLIVDPVTEVPLLAFGVHQGSPVLVLNRPDGRPWLYVGPYRPGPGEDHATLRLFNDQEEPVVECGVEPERQGGVLTIGRSDGRIAVIIEGTDEGGYVGAFDPRATPERPAASLGVTDRGGVVRCMDDRYALASFGFNE